MSPTRTDWTNLAAVLALGLAHVDYQLEVDVEDMRPYMCDILGEMGEVPDELIDEYYHYWSNVSADSHFSLSELLYAEEVLTKKIDMGCDYPLRLKIGRAYWGAVAERAKTAGTLTQLHNAGKSAVRELNL